MSVCDGGGARGGPGGREGAGDSWALGEQQGAEPGVGWEAACLRWVGESGGGGCSQVSGLLPH